MRWLVVEFIQDNNNVEVIPKNWLSTCNSFCYWPIAESIINLTKAIKQCKPVDRDSWKQYKIRIRSRVYDDFNQASRKAKKACEASELSETDMDEQNASETIIRKRGKQRNNDFLYNISESDEDDVLPPMPTPPPTLGKEGTPQMNKKTKESLHIQQLPAESQQTNPNIALNYNDFSKLINKVNSIIETQRTHEIILDNILRELQAGGINKESKKLKAIHNFPLQKMEDLEDMDKNFTVEANYDQLVQELSRIGGYDYRETTRRILNKVLHDELAKLLSFKGHKGKISFSKFRISRVVVDAVILSDKKSTSEKDVEALIGIWLSKASERLKSAQRKVTEAVADV